MIININTDRKNLRTWKEARAWCHVWWLTAIGGLDIGTLERKDLMRLAHRFRRQLMRTLDIQGFQKYHGNDGHWHTRLPYRDQPFDAHHKALEGALEMINCALNSPEKVGSWTEVAYGVSNALVDGQPHVTPCQQYPGIPKEDAEDGEEFK